MEEIGKALKSIFDKLSDFFDIFDLSFIVSGVFTTGIIYYWARARNIALPALQANTLTVILVILFCYINGLLSFALGRWIRMGLFVRIANILRKNAEKGYPFDNDLTNILKAHGLDKDTMVNRYMTMEKCRGAWRLYVRFWAELRNDEKYAKSLSLLKRYWVMAAT